GLCQVTIRVDDKPRNVELVRVTLEDGYSLLVASNLDRFQQLERLFGYGLLGCALAVLVSATLGGVLIRRALLGRVQRISQTTSSIIEGKLS
ncbi:hypothetical protein ACJBT8_10435, partial [Streptococcus suis]